MDEKGKNTNNESNRSPKDVEVIRAMLEEANIKEYEPCVVTNLLDYMHHYVAKLLIDAKKLSKHADKDEIDLDDVRLATSTAPQTEAKPPTLSELHKLAEEVNAVPLKPIPKYGSRLPPDRFCTTAQNYKLRETAKTETITKPEQAKTFDPVTTKTSEPLCALNLGVEPGSFISIKKVPKGSKKNVAGTGQDFTQGKSVLKTSVKPSGSQKNIAGGAAGNDTSQAKSLSKTKIKPNVFVPSKNPSGSKEQAGPRDDYDGPSTSRGLKRHRK